MKATTKFLHTQGTLYTFSEDAHLESWIEAFLIDRKVQNLSEGTLSFYRKKLKVFAGFCETQIITNITDLTPTTLRLFLLYLEDTGHNPGGIHAFYRSIRAFLNWWEEESEPELWKNPIKKVKPPRVPDEPLDPARISEISRLLDTCEKNTFTGKRDRSIFLCLLDTGTRAQEFLDIHLEDINPIKGDILVRQGKGRKPRVVYLGRKSRRAIRTYLRHRSDNTPWLWVRKDGMGPLKYDGLRAIIIRRAHRAEIPPPSLHAFRRAFAINMLRSGTDLHTLAKLMGHSDISNLQRYLKLDTGDTQAAHLRAGPVDHLL